MLETHKDEIDAETVVARIRENLRQRGPAAGESYDEDTAQALPREDLPLISELVRRHMILLKGFQDPRPQGPVASHESRVIEQAKRFIRRVLAPYHRGIFARQAEFNMNLVGLMAGLLQALEKSAGNQRTVLGGIQDRHETLQAQQAAHAQQTAEQAQALTALTTRLETLQAEQAQALTALTTRLETLQAEQVQALTALTTRLETLQAEHQRIAVQLESRVSEVMNRLANQYRTSEDHAAKHVDFGRRLEEQRQEMILQKRRLDLILSELRKRVGGKRESLSKVVAQKERLMDHSYFLFENRHRGSLEEIKKRQEIYLPIFKERSVSSSATSMTLPRAILDIGCGRGEFLELLREHGVPAKGIDLNEDMVHFCKERGLDVEQTNAIAFLEAQPDESLGGIIACQVIEHLQVNEMIELIKLCHQKLEPGGRAVFETVNPLNIVVSATNFYLDLSHVRQVHPTALQFLAEAVGFINTEIKFLAPYPDELKLQFLPGNDATSQQINENFRRLNDTLFSYQDFAVLCEK
jgi:O-antigen chain-terminating methyltransferase